MQYALGHGCQTHVVMAASSDVLGLSHPSLNWMWPAYDTSSPWVGSFDNPILTKDHYLKFGHDLNIYSAKGSATIILYKECKISSRFQIHVELGNLFFKSEY